MSLPPPLAAALRRESGGEPREIVQISADVGGQVVRCLVGDRRCVVKYRWPEERASPAPLDLLAAEARGLRLLRDARVLRVPEVYAQAEATSDCPAFLLMEWIESRTGTDRNKAGAALGYKLALLHRQTSGEYGLDYDNYCGASVQLNGWYASWLDFFRERRLGAQTQMAQAAGLLPPERGRKLARLLDVLDTWIDDRPEPPSLLHGDLWSGNWLIDGDGEPVLIDPAVYYGHREAELAMCRLFGGFPPDFFAAYDAVCAPLPGRDERLPLYQLYHLLNHLNLYGESYGRQVDQILLRYVG